MSNRLLLVGALTLLACGARTPLDVDDDGSSSAGVGVGGAPSNSVGSFSTSTTTGVVGSGGGCLGPGVEVLVTEDEGLFHLAADDQYAYYVMEAAGLVRRVPLCGGEAETIASGQARPFAIAVDDAFVYFAEGPVQGSVARVPKGGGPVEVMWVPDGWAQPEQIVVDATHVYVSNPYGDETQGLYRIPKDQPELAERLVSGGVTRGIGIDAAWVYYGTNTADELALRRIPKSGGPSELLADEPAWAQIAVDATHVAWGSSGSNSKLVILPLDGSPSVHIDDAGDGPLVGAAFAGDRVLWTSEWDGLVHAANRDGTNHQIVAENQITIEAMAVTHQWIVWANYGNSAIVRMAR